MIDAFIQFPLRRVVMNIFPVAIQFHFVVDDVFPIIALPQYRAWGLPQFVDAFGDSGFERGHGRTNGSWLRSRRANPPVALFAGYRKDSGPEPPVSGVNRAIEAVRDRNSGAASWGCSGIPREQARAISWCCLPERCIANFAATLHS